MYHCDKMPAPWQRWLVWSNPNQDQVFYAQSADRATWTPQLLVQRDDEDSANSDVINITYTTEFVYISRACGYSSIFNLDNVPSTAFNVEADADNWILSFEINNSRIENETQAHITLLH